MSKRKLEFYLSGPMTGLPDHNYPYFIAVEAKLKARGLKIRSPHHVGAAFTTEQHLKLGWDFFIRQAMRDLIISDAVIMLSGWEKSKGARLELDIALDLEMPVFVLMTDDTLVQIAGELVDA